MSLAPQNVRDVTCISGVRRPSIERMMFIFLISVSNNVYFERSSRLKIERGWKDIIITMYVITTDKKRVPLITGGRYNVIMYGKPVIL